MESRDSHLSPFTREVSLAFRLHWYVVFSHRAAVVDTPIGASVSKEELIAVGLVNPDGTYVNPAEWKTIPLGAATYVLRESHVTQKLIRTYSYIVAAFEPSILEHTGAYLADAALAPDATSSDGKDKVGTFSMMIYTLVAY